LATIAALQHDTTGIKEAGWKMILPASLLDGHERQRTQKPLYHLSGFSGALTN
jgi:hypothetical protein